MKPQLIRPVSLRKARDATEAALNNELVTRQRVELLEEWVTAWGHLTFWQRLCWLVIGRCP